MPERKSRLEVVIRINSDGFTGEFYDRDTGELAYEDKWTHDDGECLPLSLETLAKRLPEPFKFLGNVCEEHDYCPLDVACELAIFEDQGTTAYHDMEDE